MMVKRIDSIPDPNRYYILVGPTHEVRRATLEEWGRWFEDMDNRRVAETVLGFVRISTICLGIDHRWSGKGPPIIFESMVFENEKHMHPRLKRAIREEIDQARYSSWDDALAGHNAMVKRYERIEVEAGGQAAKIKKGRSENAPSSDSIDTEVSPSGTGRPTGRRGRPE